MANRFPLIFNSGAGQIQELAASDNLDLTSSNLVNAGILFTSSGSVTAPSLQIGSGTTYNPGLYSPGTDQLAVATNGTGRLFVDSSGNVSIGSSSFGTYSDRVISLYSTTNPSIKLSNSTTGSTLTDGIEVILSGSDGYLWNRENASWIFGTNNTERLRITSTGALNFVGAGTAGSTQAVSFNGSAPVNSLVIDSSGRLGIGSSSPAANLQVNAASDVTIALSNSSSVTSGSRGSISCYNSAVSSVGTIRFAAVTDNVGTEIQFFTRPAAGSHTQTMTLDSAGRLGIGSTGPLAKLDVISSTLPQVYFSSSETDATTKYLSIASRQRNSAAEPEGVSVIAAECSAGDNGIYIGGYLGELNAATVIKMYTANSLTTRSGTERFSINSTGTTTLTSAAATAPFVANIGASEAARIDSSGRLLVGTSTARTSGGHTGSFQLEGTTFATATAAITTNSSDSNGAYLNFGKARGGSIGSTTIVQSGDVCGQIQFNGSDGTSLQNAALITAVVDGTPGANDMPGRLVFSTNPGSPATSPTERMRITQAGLTKISDNGGSGASRYTNTSNHVIHSSQNDQWALAIEHTGSTLPYGITVEYVSASPNGASNAFFTAADSTAARAVIRSNGGLANYSANNANLSDRNVKKDITLASNTWSCVKEWEIVNYRYKDQPDDADLNLGVIAQQVAESCPEVITIFQEAKEATEDKPAQEERLGVKEQQMYWMAIKALQEAMERIEQLETEMAAVKAQLV